MKKLLGIVLLALWMSSCGPPQAEIDATSTRAAADSFATQTAEAPTATPTASATPTKTPSPTPTPLPSLEGVALALADLPAGFEDDSLADLGILGQVLKDSERFTVIEFAAFHSPARSERLLSYLGHYPRRAGFAALADDELYSVFLSLSAGAGQINMSLPVDAPPTQVLGDQAVWRTMLGGPVDSPLRFDEVAFRRGDFVILLFDIYPSGWNSGVQLGDLAATIDQRLLVALANP